MIIACLVLLFILAHWMPSDHTTCNMQVYVKVLLLLVTVHCLVGLSLQTVSFLAFLLEAYACTGG